MKYKFTKSGERALEIANSLATELGHKYVGTEHLLYSLVKEKNGIASKVLQNQNITENLVLEKIENIIGKNEKSDLKIVSFTPRMKKVIENAFNEAKNLDIDYIGTEHLLLGIIKEYDSIATRILFELNIDMNRLYKELVKILNDIETEEFLDNYALYEKKIPQNLKQFGTDLTYMAKIGKLDPVIEREEEIQRVIEILSRRIKNNPCLIGEPGVGKTAVIEGLAQRIVDNNVPEVLRNKHVIALDISAMVAGAKYRGDFEERVKKVLNEVRNNDNIILFIDEIHTIVGAGAAEGAIDAANILKPLLSRGEIQLIGATTITEYRKYIEKDSALERRFGKILLKEPSKQATIKILEGLRDKYEAHHNIKISNEAIDTAVELSSRYITDRFLPDKAIDLIDEACSRAKLKVYTEPEELKNGEKKLIKLEKEKENAINIQNFEKAAKLRDEYEIEKNILENNRKNWNNTVYKNIITIGKEDIANVLSSITGIPTQKITENENKKLEKLEEIFHESIIGQNEAVSAVAKAIKRSRIGLKDPERPIGSFLFLGPTGVGKTELAKTVAWTMFDNKEAIIRLDMSEYMQPSDVSKIIGAPPGYVGYDDINKSLTELVRIKPYTVILFDEIEKAHPTIMNVLLQILEDRKTYR